MSRGKSMVSSSDFPVETNPLIVGKQTAGG